MQTQNKLIRSVSTVPTLDEGNGVFRRAGSRLLLVFLTLALVLNYDVRTVSAAEELEITPITWNTIGVNVTNPELLPDEFPAGARVCNSGDATAANLTVSFIWQTESDYIDLTGPDSYNFPTLAPDSCQDFYFYVSVIQSDESIGAFRQYSIEVSSDQTGPISIPSPREIYIESFEPDTSLSTSSIEGPTQVVVGQTYDYVVESDLTDDFPQLVHFLDFPPQIFRLVSVQTNFGSHPDIDYDKLYADACGWQEDPDSLDYRTCVGPPDFPGGTVSGSVSTIYTVEVLSAGEAVVRNNLYGYNGESFLHNEDVGQIVLDVRAENPTPTPTYTQTPEATATVTPTYTFTPTSTHTSTVTPTPTFTGTLRPVMGAGKTPVGGTELRLNNTITFNIRVVNTGTGPADNVLLTDNLTVFTYLNIDNLETTKGLRNIDARIATVDIGTMMPNEVVTVTLRIRVSSTPATTQNPCNTATITFGTTGRVTTNQACFRVIGGPVLPGTGELVELKEAGETASFNWMTPVFTLLIIGLITAALRTRHNKKHLFIISGVLLITASIGLILNLQGKLTDEPDVEISAQIDIAAETTRDTSATPTLNPFAVHPTYEFTELVLETLPAFQIPAPTITVTAVPGDPKPDISPVRRIRIPSIDLDTVVAYVPFEESTWLIQGLREEVAWMGDTSWPGLGGNTGLAGHVTVRGLGEGPFWKLNTLSNGETVTLYTEENAYIYKVREQRVVEEWDFSVIEPTSDPQITLITCVEWDQQNGVYLKRLVVFADLLQVESLNTYRGY